MNVNDKFRDDFFSTLAETVNTLCETDKGIKVAKEITRLYGGSVIYVLKNQQEQIDERHEAIFADFDGKNIKQLALKYKVSEQTIYNIINKMRDKNQLKLFD